MSKTNMRFIALLVMFTSVISFLPVGLSGQSANAADVSEEAIAIQVYVNGSSTPITPTADEKGEKTIYSTTNYNSDGFDIAVKDVSTTQAELEKQADTKKLTGSGTVSGIVDQEVSIVSINGTSCNTAEGQAILSELDIDYTTDSENPNTSTTISGKLITGLPLGVNKIKYKVKVTTQDVDYTAATTDSNGNPVSATVTVNDPDENSYSTKEITIYHGTEYASNASKISKMLFKAYIGSSSYFNDDDSVSDDDIMENNTIPFLYSTEVEHDDDMPLKYTFNVPDSTTSLKYMMTFGETIPIEGATIYKNGAKAGSSEYTIEGKTVTGNLESLNVDSDLIVIKLNSTSSSIEKSYAIQIKYNQLDATEDYSLVKSGVTKYNYDEDSDVEAYIGKKFDVTENSAGFSVYTGDIYIDKKASMISISPTLVRSSSTVAYVLTNNYYDEDLKKTVSGKSALKSGSDGTSRQYINFMEGSTNQLQLDVYEGENGSKTSSSKLLARYLLNVNLLTTDSFTLDLAFDDNDDSTYLTQPGVSKDDGGEIDFYTDRRTYDLYSSDPVKVSFALNSENDEYTGIRSGKNEYLRVWLADSVNSNNLKEAQASKDNELDDNNMRDTSVNIDLDGAQKMVIQAYYDDFDDTGSSYVSYPVGNQYIFYLPNNIDDSDDSGDGETSDNALLNYLKVKDATLEDSDGNEEFSSDVYDYTTTVAKDDTIAKITATAQDDNVDSIVATVEGTETSYDLVSGEASEITLDEDGKTTVNIVVTAQDGTTTKTYTIVITNNTKSSNVNLEDVILNTGDYTFDSTEDTTTVHVSQSTTSIKVTPVPEDSNATVTVDEEEYTGSAIIVSLRGSQKTEIEIVVESEDGTESKTYTLEVYRTDSDEWDEDSDDSDDSDEDDQYYDEYNNCWVDTTKYEEWGTIKSKPAYFDKNNRQVKEAWVSTGGKYYYLNSSGYRASGWKVDDADGKTYYLDPKTGEMRTGWMNLNNSWYYLGKNGVMQKGWIYINGKWYYFTPNGQMVINQSMYIDGKVYKFGQDGSIY